MSTIVGLYLIVLAGVVVLKMLADAFSGRVDLLSIRNFFLLGLIVFQLTGASVNLLSDYYGAFRPGDPDAVAGLYAILATAFTVLFLVLYRWGPIVRLLAWRARTKPINTGATTLLMLAGLLVVLGVLGRFGLNRVPVFGGVFDGLGNAMLATAAGLVGWVWAPRLTNPIVAIWSLGVLGMSAGITLVGDFGRRDILGVLLALAWGAYHAHWKWMGPKATLVRVGLVGGLLFVMLAFFTAARQHNFREGGLGNVVNQIKSASLNKGSLDLLSGQNAGANVLWTLETHPGTFSYDTLHSARLFLTLPIPRAIWPAKPQSLALTMPRDINVRQKAKNWNVGPGILGHIVNDNPWVSLLPYALILALFCRFFDEVVAVNPSHPFLVIPVGIALGQVIGIPRGELALFFAFALLYIVGSFATLLFAYSLLRAVGFAPPLDDSTTDDSWGIAGDGPHWDQHGGWDDGPWTSDHEAPDLITSDHSPGDHPPAMTAHEN